MKPHLLILGGTSEARRLAAAVRDLNADLDLKTTVSLAGRTEESRNPVLQTERYSGSLLRIGGFGGAAGLREFLQAQAIDFMIDATHPFAQRISAHAIVASETTTTPLLRLERPRWTPQTGDRWIEVADAIEAASLLPALGRRIWLTTGEDSFAAFAPLSEHWFLVRLLAEPSQPLPFAQGEVTFGRGPFKPADERRLIDKHRIDVLVSKDSGGDEAKLRAAREASIPVILLRRPNLAPGPCVDIAGTIDAATRWLIRQIDRLTPSGKRFS